MHAPPPPRIDDADAAARLRAACADAGYTEDAVRARLDVPLGLPAFAAGVMHDMALADADPDDRLSVLIRLLARGTPVAAAAAERALAPATLDDLAAMGIVQHDDRRVVTTVRLTPVQGLLLLADRGGADPPPDVVLGDNAPARMLALLTHRRPVEHALDVGTGGGIQALLAAAHARRVTASDVNDRALAFARANAALNGIDNVEWVNGSWLEPAANRQFDLIVANPPYAISPDTSLLYRDGGFDGDGVTRHVVTEVARHLAPGGTAFITGNWAVDPAPDADWSAPVRSWLEASGCDALALRFEPVPAAEYAARWTSSRLAAGAAEYEATARRWHDHLRAIGIELVCFGAVVLRRTDGPARVRAVDAPGGPTGPCGEHVLRLLGAATVEPPAVDLDRSYRLAEGVRIEQTISRRDGRYRSHPAVVRLTPGLPVKAAVDPAVLKALYRCDGTRPLKEAASDADVAKVTEAVQVLLHTGLASADG